jgi:LmbE family N-acetylglucosaminyl deacetylase
VSPSESAPAVTRRARNGRVVVVSPHLDDAVLSLGAHISSLVCSGASVCVLTVFAGDRSSSAPAGGWDRRAGFGTEAEAANARRAEDLAACAVVGATPRWLSFGDSDYERHGDQQAVLAAVHEALAGSDAALLPGAPLTHPDHSFLMRTLAPSLARLSEVGLYAEQPYSSRAPGSTQAPEWLENTLECELRFDSAPVGARDWVAKWRAIRTYRSQLPLLGLGGTLALERELVAQAGAGGELVAWVSRA